VTISAGSDAALFNIITSDSVTAFIRFKTSPNFEAPADVGGNNVYEITLTATDAAANAGTQSITITVTDVVDTSSFNSLTLAGSATTATYRTVVVITANVTVASKVTFRVNGKILPGCKNKSTTGSSPNIVATCTWKPSIRGNVSLTAGAVPTGAGISSSTSTPLSIMVGNRSGSR
jgi:serralysin